MSKEFDRVCYEGLLYSLKSIGLSEKYYGLINSFLRNMHQRVVLNGQGPSRINVRVIVFLVYINQSPNGLFSNSILFANDASIFSVVIEHLNSSNKPNEDLAKIYQWAYRWKMSFNPEVSKQAQEVTFSCKKDINNHPVAFFNNLPRNRKSIQIQIQILNLTLPSSSPLTINQ